MNCLVETRYSQVCLLQYQSKRHKSEEGKLFAVVKLAIFGDDALIKWKLGIL